MAHSPQPKRCKSFAVQDGFHSAAKVDKFIEDFYLARGVIRPQAEARWVAWHLLPQGRIVALAVLTHDTSFQLITNLLVSSR
jgi:hypothetical protein